MRILLTNDDGINAQGINSLYKHLTSEHEVYVIAPIEEKSGCSSAITMYEHIKIENTAPDKFAVHGFTADCVNIGLKGNLIPEIDLVISGINHGPNCGDDTYFSGTVAGARVGYIYGLSSIAVSIDCYGEDSQNIDDTSKFLLDYIKELDILNLKNPVFLNINYPDITSNEICGVKYTCLGKRHYHDSYKILHKDKNEIKLQFNGGITENENKGSDITELKKGYITITPLTLDCTDYRVLDNYNKDR